ncbi:MAG: hypothetical protein Q7T39_22340 [Polaromonas sp.]|nr:hypothetical protein [Polaromonas sp.]
MSSKLEQLAKEEKELQAKLAAIQSQKAELANEDYKSALEYLKKNNVDFNKLAAYHREINGKVIFAIDYQDAQGKTQHYERKNTDVGATKKSVSDALKAMGYEKLKAGVKDAVLGDKYIKGLTEKKPA